MEDKSTWEYYREGKPTGAPHESLESPEWAAAAGQRRLGSGGGATGTPSLSAYTFDQRGGIFELHGGRWPTSLLTGKSTVCSQDGAPKYFILDHSEPETTMSKGASAVYKMRGLYIKVRSEALLPSKSV